jgi:hypothetical protein
MEAKSSRQIVSSVDRHHTESGRTNNFKTDHGRKKSGAIAGTQFLNESHPRQKLCVLSHSIA